MIEIVPLVIGVILAQISLGPNMLAVSSVALGTGRKAAVLTATGVAVGVFVWAILFSFGVGAFLKLFPETIIALKFIGGGYLLYMGLKALAGLFKKEAASNRTQAASSSNMKAFTKGFVVVITNPKAAMMWIAISLFLASSALSQMAFLIVGGVAALSAFMIYGTYALLFSTGIAVRAYERFFKFIDASFGLVFSTFAVLLITDGLEDVRAK